MDKATRTHIRNLLWNLRKIRKHLKIFSEVLTEEIEDYQHHNYSEKALNWTTNQILFYRFFNQVVDQILQESTSEVNDLFKAKYFSGTPSKTNSLVSYETHLSESTIKRRDNEFLGEIANRLGWTKV